MHSFVVQNLPEFIKSNPLPTAKNPPMADSPQVSEQDWNRVETLKERADSYLTEPHLCNITVACCLVELRDRVVALEAAGSVAGNPGHDSAAPAGGWSGVAVDCLPPGLSAVWVGTPADVAPQVVPTTPAVLTVDELADCLPSNAWAGPEGYSRQAFARHLLDHPRIGPLLRGEGTAAPKRVVLPERPPIKTAGRSLTELAFMAYRDGCCDTWAAARAEVERQQQGGQADG